MDTKLKKYRYSAWLKALAVVVCVAGMITTAYGLLKAPYFNAAIQNKDIKKSMYLRDTLVEPYIQIYNIALNYKNEENIKSGACLDKNEINNRRNQLLSDKQIEVTRVNDYYRTMLSDDAGINGEITDNSDPLTENSPEKQKILDERKSEIDKIENEYKTKDYNLEPDYIKEQLADYHAKLDDLNKQDGIYYAVEESGKMTTSNIDANSAVLDFFKALPVYYEFHHNSLDAFDDGYFYTGDIPSNTFIYMGLSDKTYKTVLSEYNKELKEGLYGIKFSLTGLIAFLLGLIYIIYGAGRSSRKEGLQLLAIDDMYLDVALALTIGIIALCTAPLFKFGRYVIFKTTSYYNSTVLTVLLSVAISVGTLAGIVFLTMFVRRVKRHEVIKNTLIHKVYAWSKRNLISLSIGILKLYDGSPAALRLILIFGAYAVGTLIGISLLFTYSFGILAGLAILVGINVTAVYLLLEAFEGLKDIKESAQRIRLGELSPNIPPQRIPEFRELSETIHTIADGLKEAVSSQVKAERMKAELITNVSHDLKTPLTSIITYVDLLKSEGLASENSQKYLDIIDTKSQRLQTLTEDLFEAAKASSGNIAVNFNKINVVSLIDQGLGELSDKIESSGLIFKTNFSSDKLFVKADGKLLWRIIENLISNVFKYALPGSRVYIDTAGINSNIIISIKNISAHELNIPAEELLERFKRGDDSRSSEGSGLGLSIVKSLTELQGGSFSVVIDGDLFKATVVMPEWSDR